MATIAVRRIDPATGEPQYGHGLQDFLYDNDAVAQIIATTLKLFTGESWEDRTAGTPMFTDVLGKSGKDASAIATTLQSAIYAASPYVTEISDIATSFASGTRALQFTAVVQTAFGTVTVAGIG